MSREWAVQPHSTQSPYALIESLQLSFFLKDSQCQRFGLVVRSAFFLVTLSFCLFNVKLIAVSYFVMQNFDIVAVVYLVTLLERLMRQQALTYPSLLNSGNLFTLLIEVEI